MLKKLNYKGVYKSDQDNILEDFYFPALSLASQYDRAVGFFSSSSISYAAQALSVFVNNGGKIRLILGAFTEKQDLIAIEEGYSRKALAEKIGEEMLDGFIQVTDELFQNRFEALCWLVANDQLEIKIALREQGMFHDKVGIITDAEGDKVVFAGSANESSRALMPSYNYESINVFKSWIPEHAEFFEPHIDSFSRLWENKSKSTIVLDIPTAVRDKLISIADSLDYIPGPEIEKEIASRIQTTSVKTGWSSKPRIPTSIEGHPFQIRDHQISALRSWKDNGYKGTFDLATGSGKTITAIYAIVKLSEKLRGLTCVIAVPYQNLADQWVDILNIFNIHPLKCYATRFQWENKLSEIVYELAMGTRDFATIVVVNRTLKSHEFQKQIKKINGDRLLWIGDECHHHTSTAYEGFLPTNSKYRIGLSATPKHYFDEDKNERLNQFYGNIVAEYSLKDAVQQQILTPYFYYPHLVEFTPSEADEFVFLSEKIGKMAGAVKDNEIPAHLSALLMKRARLIGCAANKLHILEKILTGKKPTKHTLFYCGDGSVESDDLIDEFNESLDHRKKQIESVITLLYRLSWDISRFTARETRKERNNTLDNFRLGIIDAMVAIRCLDEGIDVPACSVAYILASSRNPRQFIQRRGRILRRSHGKESAVIHDFIVVLPDGYDTESNFAKRLIKSELIRVAEFSSLSENRSEAYMALAPILRTYDLEHII